MVGRLGKLPRCQRQGCRNRVDTVVDLELPASWSGDGTYTVLVVPVGACRGCARELRRRQGAMLEARRDLVAAMGVIERAVLSESELRRQMTVEAEAHRREVQRLDEDLAMAHGAVQYAHECREQAERSAQIDRMDAEAARRQLARVEELAAARGRVRVVPTTP